MQNPQSGDQGETVPNALKMLSLRHWRAWAVFFRLKVIRETQKGRKGWQSQFWEHLPWQWNLMVSFDQIYLEKTVQSAMRSFRDCMLGRVYLSGTVTALRWLVVSAGAPRAIPILLGHQVQRGRSGRVGVANKNTCFLHCKELLLRDTVLLKIQPPQGRAKM